MYEPQESSVFRRMLWYALWAVAVIAVLWLLVWVIFVRDTSPKKTSTNNKSPTSSSTSTNNKKTPPPPAKSPTTPSGAQTSTPGDASGSTPSSPALVNTGPGNVAALAAVAAAFGGVAYHLFIRRKVLRS